MSRDPLPEPWRSELEIKGIHSKRGLATKAGISPQTAKRLIDGEGSPSHATVAAVADAIFGGNRDRVWELAGFERQDHGDWSLPPEASLLDPEQRAAVLAVVRAMLPPEQRAGDGDDRDATSTRSPGPERTVADVLQARRQANMKMQTEAARDDEAQALD